MDQRPKVVRDPQIRKVKSMHELRKEIKKTEDFFSSDDEVKGVPVKLADKIDHFLVTVNRQQEALAKMLEERKYGRTSVVSRMSSVTASKAPPPRKKSQRPQTARAPIRSTPPKMANLRQSTDFKSFDTSKAMSKLKSDRNYQPPRRKKAIQQSTNSTFSLQQKKELKRKEPIEDEYENDFEDDEDDNADQLLAKQKEAWLYDQAIRGRARQKAAEALRHHNQKNILGYQEKESSKDSAYGFSGGENSRLHTREPTPDTNNHHVQPRIINHGSRLSRGPPPPVCQNPSLRKQFSASFGHNRKFSPPTSRRQRPVTAGAMRAAPKDQPQAFVHISDTKKVEFLNQVTQEILRRGNFTEKAIKRVLDTQLNEQVASLSIGEKTDLVNKLKEQFGLGEKNSVKRPIVMRTNPRRTTSESSSTSSNTKVVVKTPKIEIKKESFDDDLSSIFKDDSDSEVAEIVKSTMRRRKIIQSPSSSKPKHQDDEVPRMKVPVATKKPGGELLFNSLNLTNLNVSFNSANMQEAKRRLEENRTQALLVKSFAYNDKKDDSDHSKKESSDAEDDQEGQEITPRSSNLYQSESDHPLEEEVEEVASSVPEEEESASIIDDEDIPQEL